MFNLTDEVYIKQDDNVGDVILRVENPNNDNDDPNPYITFYRKSAFTRKRAPMRGALNEERYEFTDMFTCFNSAKNEIPFNIRDMIPTVDLLRRFDKQQTQNVEMDISRQERLTIMTWMKLRPYYEERRIKGENGVPWCEINVPIERYVALNPKSGIKNLRIQDSLIYKHNILTVEDLANLNPEEHKSKNVNKNAILIDGFEDIIIEANDWIVEQQRPELEAIEETIQPPNKEDFKNIRDYENAVKLFNNTMNPGPQPKNPEGDIYKNAEMAAFASNALEEITNNPFTKLKQEQNQAAKTFTQEQQKVYDSLPKDQKEQLNKVPFAQQQKLLDDEIARAKK